MTNLTKKDLLLILNIYQNYINDFVNISHEDLNKMYLQIAKEDLKNLITKNKDVDMYADFFNGTITKNFAEVGDIEI